MDVITNNIFANVNNNKWLLSTHHNIETCFIIGYLSRFEGGVETFNKRLLKVNGTNLNFSEFKKSARELERVGKVMILSNNADEIKIEITPAGREYVKMANVSGVFFSTQPVAVKIFVMNTVAVFKGLYKGAGVVLEFLLKVGKAVMAWIGKHILVLVFGSFAVLSFYYKENEKVKLFIDSIIDIILP